MYRIFLKLTRSSAIALAVISISSTAVADSMTNDTRVGSWQTPARTFHVSGPIRQTRVPGVSAVASSAPLTSTAPRKSNKGPAELLMLGIPVTPKGGNRLKALTDHERMLNTPGNLNDDNIFNGASSPATVRWVVAKKCGWICVVRKF